PLTPFSLRIPPPPRSPLFPYTTLFRSYLLLGTIHTLPPLPKFLRLIEVFYLKFPIDILLQTHIPTLMTELLVIENSDRSSSRKRDRKSTRLNSSHVSISYAVFCLKKKN